MDAEAQKRLAVVLVRARNPANIGAVARAMHDLGFADLRVVNEFAVPFAAAKSAVHAEVVLDAAREHATVAEAVADCTLVLGTTAVGARALEHPVWVLREAAARVRAHLARGDRAQGNEAQGGEAQGGEARGGEARVALLFGSEKTGLTNEEMAHCQALVTIPMNAGAERHLSMNLGQAAAVCLYELAQGGVAATAMDTELDTELGANAAELERLTGLLGEVLERSGYTRRHPANSREASVRRLVRRMGMTAGDAVVWTGVLRQLLHGLVAGEKKA